jgi:hypothetical protein
MRNTKKRNVNAEKKRRSLEMSSSINIIIQGSKTSMAIVMMAMSRDLIEVEVKITMTIEITEAAEVASVVIITIIATTKITTYSSMI